MCSRLMCRISLKFSDGSLDKLTEHQKDQKPSQQLLKLLAPCVPNPEVFGVQLGYKGKQLRDKFLQDTSQSIEIQTLGILQSWVRKRKIKPTVGGLIQALRGAGVAEETYMAVIQNHFTERTESGSENEGESKKKKRRTESP